MNKMIILMILAMFAVSCGGSSGGKSAADNTGIVVSDNNGGNTGNPGDNTGGETPLLVNSINDVVRDSDSAVSEVEPVDFEITLVNREGEPIANAIVSLIDENDMEITSAISNEDGIVLFTAAVETDDAVATIRIIHPDYEAREISVDGIGSLEAVIRTVGLEEAVEPVVWTDSDGDGIPDEADAFPDDSELAFVSKGKFTLKFAESGFVVRFHITEKINVRNEVVEIVLHSIPVEAGDAGYLFGVNIKGVSYMLIRDLKTGSIKPVMLNIKLETPVHRTEMPVMPYEPFVKPADMF